jgi:hypothetical protein
MRIYFVSFLKCVRHIEVTEQISQSEVICLTSLQPCPISQRMFSALYCDNLQLTLFLITMATLQVDEQPPSADVTYAVPPDSPPKKAKKKRDATTLRKAPQGK